MLPIKEDIAEWITRTVGVEITPSTFLDVLDSGIVLCKLSKLIETKAKECERIGKLTEVGFFKNYFLVLLQYMTYIEL